MKSKRNIYFYASLIVTVSITYLLVTGSAILTISLNSSNSIPLGTFLTWAGIIALPLTIYWGVKHLRKPNTKLNVILNRLLIATFILAILWLPVSWLLAGNLSFSFSEKESFQGGQTAMKWFWRYSYGIGIGAMLILLTYYISLLFRSKNRNC